MVKMNVKAGGDNGLVSNRVSEKADLQNLNQRFSAYIQAVKAAQERENQQRAIHHESIRLENQTDGAKIHYEQRILELEAKLDEANRERQELEMNRVRYDTSISNYENRIVSLNESVFEKQTELQRLHGALAAKDVELQEARSGGVQPRLALDGARMEADDFRKRLEEAERRLHLECHAKVELQQKLAIAEKNMHQEIMAYQQELTEIRGKLEKSHQLILELEEKSRKAGQNDSSLADMMRKVREASEMELRRFMEETEAKYNLNLQEVKMRMEADVHSLTALVEENGRLQADLGSQAAEFRNLEAKFSFVENQKLSAANELENERTSFQTHVRHLEQKLQETQDLLLVKIQELGAAQEANIPLRAEINALKSLVEEEEKRLNLHILSPGNPFMNAGFTTQHLTTSPAFAETLGISRRVNDSSAAPPPSGFSTNQLFGTSDSYKREINAATSFPMPNSKLRRRPASVPLATQGFRRSGVDRSQVSNIPLATPTYAPARNGMFKRSSSEIENQYRSPSADSISSQIFDLKDPENTKQGTHKMGIVDLPPRPENPTPTKLPHRPSSAANARYIPASKGQGKDYFESMFNDLRKDTLYSKVSEKESGTGTAHVSSVQQDYLNSTSSKPIDAESGTRNWYSGTTVSATGNLKLLEVSDDGSYVRVSNTSASQEETVGGFMLQQNVGGHPVAVFRFPPRARINAAGSATVWSGRALNGIHDPPSHYIWTQLDKWGTGPECTTILCKPNGQAVAWMTSAPRKLKVSRGFKYQPEVKEQTEETQRMMEDLRVKNQQYEQEHSSEESDIQLDSDGSWQPDPVTLPSSYTTKPTLYRDGPYAPKPNPVIKRPSSTQSGLHTSITAGGLASRTGSAPLKLNYHQKSQSQDFIQRLSKTDRDIIDLTTQKSARSKYGFDFMTHPPKVTNYDGTVR